MRREREGARGGLQAAGDEGGAGAVAVAELLLLEGDQLHTGGEADGNSVTMQGAGCGVMDSSRPRRREWPLE